MAFECAGSTRVVASPGCDQIRDTLDVAGTLRDFNSYARRSIGAARESIAAVPRPLVAAGRMGVAAKWSTSRVRWSNVSHCSPALSIYSS